MTDLLRHIVITSTMQYLAPKSFKPFKLALIQFATTADKAKNLQAAREKVLEASKKGANIIVLPYFEKYAEKAAPGQTTYDALSNMAKEAKSYLVGGSIPESRAQKLYNTSLVFNPEGENIATHSKVHLFDIDIPGKIKFQESEVLSPGEKLTIVETKYGSFGLAICYDIRFPELAIIAARKDCFGIIYPGAFNLTTGPLHWELLARGRAVDNQFYVGLCSPARDMDATYHAWGHSMIVNPNGEVLAEADTAADIIYSDLKPDEMNSMRNGIPVITQRQFGVYPNIMDHLK